MDFDYIKYFKETITRAIDSIVENLENGAVDQSYLAPIQIITPAKTEIPEHSISVTGCTLDGKDDPALLIDLNSGNILIHNVKGGTISITREALEAYGWRKVSNG